MAFQLEAGETLADGLGRIAAEEIERARVSLQAPTDTESGVLEARKSLKKVRAILRLTRKPLGKRRFRDENRRYRDLARRLSEQRAGAVRVKALDQLALSMDGDAPMQELQASRRRLIPRRRRYEDASVREEVARALAEAPPGIDTLALEGFEAVRPGLTRTYRRGRKRMREAIERPSAAAFHDWRKRVKDLWYHMRVFGPAWPEIFGPIANELHLLSRYLGDSHDLDLLEIALEEEAQADPLFDPSLLVSFLAAARAAKRAAAIELGQRLYAEDPAAFAERVEAHWQSWHLAQIPAE